MLLRFQTLTLALLTALLIILGGFGTFIAEAASIHGIIFEAQTYDPGAPIDAFEFGPEDIGTVSAPGLPY